MKQESVQQKNISIMSSFSGSRKVYVEGARPDIQVPMREISLSPTTGSFGAEENQPVRVYDTSGPYTDANAVVDILKGLKPLRATWIRERGDTEEYEGREIRPEDNGYKSKEKASNSYPGLKRKPLRAKKVKMSPSCITQERGSLRPRWNLSRSESMYLPNLFVMKWQADERLFRQISTIRKANR